jgi:molybdenum cofactor cytidylyltransferase
MRSILAELGEAEGALLAAPILEESGRKILAKGHRLEADDVRHLREWGLTQVCISQLEEGEVDERVVLESLADLVMSGAMEAKPAAGGRVDYFATGTGALIVHPERLHRLNRSRVAVLSTLPQFRHVRAGERCAVVRTAPLAAQGDDLRAAIQELRQEGVCAEVAPIREAHVAVVYCDPVQPLRAQQLFGAVVKQRVEAYDARAAVRSCREQAGEIAATVGALLARRPRVVLIASTVSPSTPCDAISLGLRGLGMVTEQFLLPVEPGSLLTLGYIGETAVVRAPGCFRSHRANALDLVLPPLMAGYRLTSDQVTALGVGGLMGLL